ncbi:ammonia monooxygenase family protein [Vibrio anguillarum]|nr:ammonia monooxygenase family protein [Vibrio anguillarum]
MVFATALLGILIGARLADTTLREAMAYSRAGVMVTLIGLLVAVAVSGLFALLLDKSWVVLLLAWVPGSVEAMTAVALLLGMEPAFVMINHALRLLLLYSLPAVLKKPLEALRSK